MARASSTVMRAIRGVSGRTPKSPSALNTDCAWNATSGTPAPSRDASAAACSSRNENVFSFSDAESVAAARVSTTGNANRAPPRPSPASATPAPSGSTPTAAGTRRTAACHPPSGGGAPPPAARAAFLAASFCAASGSGLAFERNPNRREPTTSRKSTPIEHAEADRIARANVSAKSVDETLVSPPESTKDAESSRRGLARVSAVPVTGASSTSSMLSGVETPSEARAVVPREAALAPAPAPGPANA